MHDACTSVNSAARKLASNRMLPVTRWRRSRVGHCQRARKRQPLGAGNLGRVFGSLHPGRARFCFLHLHQAPRLCSLDIGRLLTLQTRTAKCSDASGRTLPDDSCQSGAKPQTAQTCQDCIARVVAAPGPGAAPVQSSPSVDSSLAPSSTGSSSSSGSSNSTAVIAGACAAGAALAIAAAAAMFVLIRRMQHKHSQSEQPGAASKGAANDAGADIVPPPRHLKPIVTGRGRNVDAMPAAKSSGPRHVSAAAGAAAAHHIQCQQAGIGAHAVPVEQLQYAPEYHVLHMPSPRFAGVSCLQAGPPLMTSWNAPSRSLSVAVGAAGHDTGSPSGVRRALRQRSPTRRPRDGARSTPDALSAAAAQAGSEHHRLARSSSGHVQ